MEAVASLTALITFSLQTTKFVYQALDGIRDGPSVIASLVESTKHVEGILQQLLQLINHNGQSGQDPTIWESLQQKISQCSRDMREASEKLKVLSPSNASGQIDRAWKRVKISLKEKFFARLDDQIKSHLAELGLQLQIVNTDIRQTQEHQTSQTSLRGINNELSLQSASLHNHIAENAQGIKASLTTLTTGIHAADKSRMNESSRLRESLEQIGSTVVDNLNQTEQSSKQYMQLSNQQIAAQFDQVRAMSEDQSRTIVELLGQIYGRLSTVVSADSESDQRAQDGLNDNVIQATGKDLSTAIDRLCSLASDTTTTYDSDEAEDIIDDLKCIINTLLNQSAESIATHSGGRRKRHDDSRDPDVPYEVKKILGVLTASRAVQITRSNSARMPREDLKRQKRTRQSMEVYDMAELEAVVSFKSIAYGKSTAWCDTGKGPMRIVHDTLQGRIQILPKNSDKITKISASFTQQFSRSGSSSPYPRLTFHPIIPDGADIFVAVENGDVTRILELLDNGKASLRDCDCDGRSLLNVCIHVDSSSMNVADISSTRFMRSS
ncbi:MAG: hypothetical protein Q9216_002017 [Gyalolechia sp. 2 TL-2023]